VALSNALKVNKSLTSVELYANNLRGAAGAIALGKALKVNTSVTSVNVDGNQIGNQGALALADALTGNATLTNLRVGENAVGELGARKFIDALKVNTTVTTVELWDDSIGESITRVIDAATDRNKRLRQLFLYDTWRTLLSLLCADECGVIWPYYLACGDRNGAAVPDGLDDLRLSMAGIHFERERRRRAAVQKRRANAIGGDSDDYGDCRAAKRSRAD
jgi:hypothetical protein